MIVKRNSWKNVWFIFLNFTTYMIDIEISWMAFLTVSVVLTKMTNIVLWPISLHVIYPQLLQTVAGYKTFQSSKRRSHWLNRRRAYFDGVAQGFPSMGGAGEILYSSEQCCTKQGFFWKRSIGSLIFQKSRKRSILKVFIYMKT